MSHQSMSHHKMSHISKICAAEYFKIYLIRKSFSRRFDPCMTYRILTQKILTSIITIRGIEVTVVHARKKENELNNNNILFFRKFSRLQLLGTFRDFLCVHELAHSDVRGRIFMQRLAKQDSTWSHNFSV